MDRDLRRQVAIVVTFLVTVAVNASANILPLNGLTTAEISDRFQVFVTPAPYVFGIWALIYLGQAAFTTHQARPSRRGDELLRSLGYLPAAAALLNSLWLVLWHFEVFALTVPVMFALLATLATIVLRIRERPDGRPETRWLVRLPFSIYFGWITVAAIVNVAAMLSWAGFDGLGIAGETWAVAVLLIGVLIALATVRALEDLAYALVVAWAYVGIAVKEADTTAVVATALLGAAVVAVVGVWSALGARTIGHAAA
jgi:translocator protein